MMNNNAKKLTIDIGAIIFYAVVAWLIIKGEFMAVIALCAVCGLYEVSRMRKMMSDKVEKEERSRKAMNMLTGFYSKKES